MLNRYLTAAATGMAVTLSLLYLMHLLVHLQTTEPASARTPLWLARVRVVETPPPAETAPRDFSDLTVPLGPLPTTRVAPPVVERVTLPRSLPATPSRPAGGGLAAAHAGDAPLVGVMMVQPTYPASAIVRELEGYVVVEFDVRADGSVANVGVVDSSHGVFEKPAMAAAQRCRFKARTVGGEPQPSYRVRKRFVFEMERG